MSGESGKQPMVSKRGDTRKFVVGVALIIISLVMGKISLIPLVLFPGNIAWIISCVAFYAVSWVIIVVGVVLAGKEGYRLAVRLYKEYQKKALVKVRDQGKRAAHGAVVALVKPIESGRRLASRTAEAARRPLRARRSARKRSQGLD